MWPSSLHYIPDNYLTTNFKFRFRWVTNGSNNNFGGCLIDDLLIRGYKSDGSGTLYDYYDGTSMATPAAAGLASLVWETNSSLTKTQVKNAVVYTGDSLNTLYEKTVSGKRINMYKALTGKQITTFSFDGLDPVSSGTINETSHTVTLRVTYGTDVTSLAPTIEHTGVSVNPASGAVQDFTNPVTYTVTASDSSTREYVVTATVKETPFAGAAVYVNGADTSQGGVIQVSNRKISITFEGAEEATKYRISRTRFFRKAKWRRFGGSIDLELGKTKRRQTIFIQLKDTNGYRSEVFKKMFKYSKSS